MSINETGRIEAELNIENYDSEDSSEKLSLIFNRKRNWKQYKKDQREYRDDTGNAFNKASAFRMRHNEKCCCKN